MQDTYYFHWAFYLQMVYDRDYDMFTRHTFIFKRPLFLTLRAFRNRGLNIIFNNDDDE